MKICTRGITGGGMCFGTFRNAGQNRLKHHRIHSVGTSRFKN